MERRLIPVYLPNGLHRILAGAKRVFVPQATRKTSIDLSGDRDIEWSYIASRLPIGSARVLDFGCGYGNMSIHAVQKGHRVLALDLEQNLFPWAHPNVEISCGDLLKLDLPRAEFDFILNCSTVEHVGLTGRYGVAVQETDGDLAAMQKLRTLLKPTGKMLMTIPCGEDTAIAPWHRVYGRERLPKLLSGYKMDEQMYWVKKQDNRWYVADRESALSYIPTSHPTTAIACSYALGCFVLRAAEDEKR